MKYLKKKKYLLAIIIAGLMLLLSSYGIILKEAYAESDNLPDDEELTESKGVYTNLSLCIGGGDGYIYATTKNILTLFSSTVNVYIYLYSSDTLQESYTDMDCIVFNYVYDLDMGDSITITAPTNGEQKYWQARLRYRLNSSDWTEKTSTLYLCDADGNVVY